MWESMQRDRRTAPFHHNIRIRQPTLNYEYKHKHILIFNLTCPKEQKVFLLASMLTPSSRKDTGSPG